MPATGNPSTNACVHAHAHVCQPLLLLMPDKEILKIVITTEVHTLLHMQNKFHIAFDFTGEKSKLAHIWILWISFTIQYAVVHFTTLCNAQRRL